jgi:hypothetical protein
MVQVPLQLWNRPHWELNGGWDSALFFRHLPPVLPAATTLFIEGTNVARDVADFLRSAAEPGDYLPMRQTLWPLPKQFRLRCDGPTLAALADLAERHAVPELLDHLFVYVGPRVLLEFPDAFGGNCPAFFSAEADEQRLRNFAAVLGLDLTSAEPSDHG